MRETAIFEFNQEWKNIATYYNETLKNFLKNYFNIHPNIGQLLKEGSNQELDYIKNVNLFDLFESTVSLLDEVIEKEHLHFLRDILPRPSKYIELVKGLVKHVKNHDKEAFEKYKTEIFNDWQRKWLRTLTNVKRQFIQPNIMDYGKNPLFLINAYVSEFELFHNLMLRPFTENVNLEEYTYRNRLNILLDCIFILEFDDKEKFNLLYRLDKIFEPKQRNSLVKHNYLFDEENNIIHLFSPDAFVRKYKPYGEIKYKEFIDIVIMMKAIFWTLLEAQNRRNNKLKEIIDNIISDYPAFFDVIELKILDPETTELLNLFVECFKGFSSVIDEKLAENYGEEIIKHQLQESFLIFRILMGVFLKPEVIPDKSKLSSFSFIQKVIIDHTMLKIQYLVIYEEMMQTVVHPFSEVLFGEIYKDFALRKLSKVENGKYSVLFEDLNKDFRDSLAHNSYYLDEKTGLAYTKYGTELKPENIKLISSQLLFNYMDITNAIFPFLAEVPTELATVQLFKDIFMKDSSFSRREWLEKERFALNHEMLIFAGMTRIRLALSYAEEDDYNAVSNTIRELFEGNDSYKFLTIQKMEVILAFIFGFIENLKARIVLKSFVKRLQKKVDKKDEIYKNCLFTLLFLASHRRDHKQVNKLMKTIREL
ncbi:MAG: hypothetical protein ACFE8J_08785 [Candidatus Heimdallarchaeota archaeon]